MMARRSGNQFVFTGLVGVIESLTPHLHVLFNRATGLAFVTIHQQVSHMEMVQICGVVMASRSYILWKSFYDLLSAASSMSGFDTKALKASLCLKAFMFELEQ